MTDPIHILWFKRDLRVVDHRPLAASAAQGHVLPLYIVEPELWAQPDASARQWEFVAECLHELNDALSVLGKPLSVLIGEAIEVLEHLRQMHGIAGLWSHEETGNGWTYKRDLAVKEWAKQHGIIWHEMRQTGVQRRIASRDGWAKAWDKDMAQPVTSAPAELFSLSDNHPLYIPTAAALGLAHDPCPFRQVGGRAVALRTLDSFLHQRGRKYRFQISSPVTAFDACSRLSPHLTWGTLSMREVAQASWNRMRHLKQSDTPDSKSWHGSMVSFSGRQHWHCHFMQKLEDEPRIEFENMHRAYDGLRPDVAVPERLEAWSAGNTGYPFVDACMRALNQHGWINFRMRAMLMSFASYHLWLPWRESGLHLARKFVDYEPGIHWSQVQMQSGTTGINTARIYNPIKQGYDHDERGIFIRKYVPELASIPDAFIHEPWLWLAADKVDYPPPIVDCATAAKAAREAIYQVRHRPDHQATAQQIVRKHASRKSTKPTTSGKQRTKQTPANDKQLTMDF
ncbi:MAG: deoxyribodipyrimidine photo-lyase [Candidatus Saccharibacteria bacterium]|nr:deoxyribodipyrimidine photo-lyase [Moraxellaceae bacterium]